MLRIAERVVRRYLASQPLQDYWLDEEDVREVCPTCADRMASLNVRRVRASVFFAKASELAGVKTAKAWSTLPKGWTQDSLKKMWDTMTGDVKHRVTKCIKKMEGKVDDPGAFCASLADRIEGKGWRSED